MKDETGRRFAWDCYFAGIMSINMHPGSGKDIGYGKAQKLTIAQCAELADEMLIERDLRFPIEAE